jgi:hypothetical protein
MITRALLGWLFLLLLAILNGALRQAVLIPRWGERVGHIVSTLLLCALILGATWMVMRWVRPASARDAWLIGGVWLGLTLGFEFLGGHYLFGDSWAELLAAYDVAAGQIWILVLITTLLAPVLVYARQGFAVALPPDSPPSDPAA